MTTAQLYREHLQGKVSKSAFLQEVRKDQNLPYVTNLTSYEDAVKILKNKSIISEEKHQLTVNQIIDRLNPYSFKSAVNFELSKIQGKPTEEEYEKIKEKVAKKLQKDPFAYETEQFVNAKEVEKRDSKLEMQPLKKNNLKDKNNEMKKAKGHNIEKRNTSVSKKENKKGKPKGVKEMRGSTKKPKGVSSVMDPQGKEKVLESIIRKMLELNENMSVFPVERTDYSKGHEITTPNGKGKVIEKHGSIVEVEMEDGTKQTYTLNVLDKHNAKNRFDDEPKPQDISKAERDQMWSDWDKQGHKSFDTVKATPMSTQDLLKKLKMVVEKLKLKKEAAVEIAPKGGTPIYVSTADAPKKEEELRAAGITNYAKKTVG